MNVRGVVVRTVKSGLSEPNGIPALLSRNWFFQYGSVVMDYEECRVQGSLQPGCLLLAVPGVQH